MCFFLNFVNIFLIKGIFSKIKIKELYFFSQYRKDTARVTKSYRISCVFYQRSPSPLPCSIICFLFLLFFLYFFFIITYKRAVRSLTQNIFSSENIQFFLLHRYFRNKNKCSLFTHGVLNQGKQRRDVLIVAHIKMLMPP